MWELGWFVVVRILKGMREEARHALRAARCLGTAWRVV